MSEKKKTKGEQFNANLSVVLANPKPVAFLLLPILVLGAFVVLSGPALTGAAWLYDAIPHMPITGETPPAQVSRSERPALAAATVVPAAKGATNIRWQND